MNFIPLVAPRVGRDQFLCIADNAVDISIHAPRVGRDRVVIPANGITISISIHAPRVGRDVHVSSHSAFLTRDFDPRAPSGARRCRQSAVFYFGEFQSTRPEWGATPSSTDISPNCWKFQSTRPEWGATQTAREPFRLSAFQSTRPEWGATEDLRMIRTQEAISIHAPRVGRDLRQAFLLACFFYFNPRAPSGARQQIYTKKYLNPDLHCIYSQKYIIIFN